MGHSFVKLQQEDAITTLISIQSSCGAGNHIGIDPFRGKKNEKVAQIAEKYQILSLFYFSIRTETTLRN